MLFFRGAGPKRFVDALNASLENEAALRHWYLSVIAALAKEMTVETANIHGLDWCEIDFPHDLGIARKMIDQWQTAEAGTLRSERA